ncbi:MAG: tRNA (guanine-N1)-methyltransferase, partial [Cyanobacteria bacterium P01_D01_bin.36]
MAIAKTWQQEGEASFCVGNAFFRKRSKIGRDLAILAASVYKTAHGQLRVLDAMTGCGVRPLRYALEADADFVWANEGNGDLQTLLQKNLSTSLSPSRYRITHQDANAAFFDCYQRQDFYD